MKQKKLAVSTKEQFCIEKKTDPCGIVIFGVSGDLAHRKLFPSLYQLYKSNYLPKAFFIIGYSRHYSNDQDLRRNVKKSLKGSPGGQSTKKRFLNRIFLQTRHKDPKKSFSELKKKVESLEQKYKTRGNLLIYFSTPPGSYIELSKSLKEYGLLKRRNKKKSWNRAVFEKPFGYDLKTASKMNERIQKIFKENQIYRMDHYLGKETVQNILIFRFANTIFEPIWNSHYIDHVQITAAETLGVEHRADYYERAGALRDIFQNHMLQLISLVAMESAHTFEPDQYRDEKVQVVSSLRPLKADKITGQVVRGQYKAGALVGKKVRAYQKEKGVARNSQVETYAAMKLFIDNWRWKGVPFYLRAGKRLKQRKTEIAIQFKHIPHSMFRPIHADQYAPNALIFRIQPNEGISLSFEAKKPGPKLCMGTLDLNVDYGEAFENTQMQAYERLLLDCMQGDQTLFVRQDMIELSWKVMEPILKAWKNKRKAPLFKYPSGSEGPAAANRLIEEDGRSWRPL